MIEILLLIDWIPYIDIYMMLILFAIDFVKVKINGRSDCFVKCH